MAIETQEREIDGFQVRCTPYKGRAGARLLARLTKYIGPLLGSVDIKKLMSSRSSGGDLAAFAPAIVALSQALTPDDFDIITCEILSRMSVIMDKNYDLSKPSGIDDAFAGNLPLMFKCMAFALEVNYAGFFPESVRDGSAVDAPAEVTAPE